MSGSSDSVPRLAPRASATPCHSGNSHAIQRIASGSWSIGKNVPENRNSGVIPKRQIELNATTSRWVVM